MSVSVALVGAPAAAAVAAPALLTPAAPPLPRPLPLPRVGAFGGMAKGVSWSRTFSYDRFTFKSLDVCCRAIGFFLAFYTYKVNKSKWYVCRC